MDYLTAHAQELDKRFQRYMDVAVAKDAAGGDAAGTPASLEDLTAINRVLGYFHDLAQAPDPKGESRLLVQHIFELGLVIRSRCDVMDEQKNPLASSLRPILLAMLRHLWGLTADATAIGKKYTEAVFNSVQGSVIGDETIGAIYQPVVGLLQMFLGRLDRESGRAAAPLAEQLPPALELLRLLAWVLKVCGKHDWVRGMRRPDTAALTDLVYYDWSLGLPVVDAGRQYYPKDLPAGDPAVHLRDAKKRTLGSPMLRDGHLPLNRFNLDLLVNLAVWQLERQPAKQPAADLAKMWEELFKHCKKTTIDGVERVPLIEAEPHANYGRETECESAEWASCKQRWLRREDVLLGGLACRFWAANDAFLRHVFESWGWVQFPSVNTTPRAVLARLDHNWPLLPALERFGQIADGQQVNLTTDQQHATDNLVEKFADKVALQDGGVVMTAAAADKGVVMPTFSTAEIEMMTIGVTGAGKTWTDMMMIHRFLGGRQAGAVSIKSVIPAFYQTHTEEWQKPAPASFKTEADQHATLDVTNPSLQFAVQATLRIRDVAGGEFHMDKLFVDAQPTPAFDDVAKRLNRAGVVAVAADVGNFLRPRQAGLGDAKQANLAGLRHEELFLEHADRRGLTGVLGSPIALLLTKIDLLGLAEPLNEGAALLAGSPPATDLEAPLDSWLDPQLARREVHTRVQLQFLNHRLRHGWQPLLTRLYRGPVSNAFVAREAAVFLTCGSFNMLKNVGVNDSTGVDAFTAWAAHSVMQRWSFTVHRLADGFARGLALVRDHTRRRLAELDRLARQLPHSIFVRAKARRAAFNLICEILEKDLTEKNDRAQENDTDYVARIDVVVAQIEEYKKLAALYERAIRGAEKVREKTKPK